MLHTDGATLHFPPRPAADEKDALGRTFDPQKFAPRKDSRGRWVNKNAGRKPSTPAGAQDSGKSFVPTDAAPENPKNEKPAGTGDRFDLAAEMYSRAGYSILDGVLCANGEWLPENDGEHIAFRGALAAYLRHNGTEDLPPNFAFYLAVATYASKRVTKPRTLSRLRMFGYWIRARIYAWRTGRRLEDLPPAPPAPPSESRSLPPQDLPPAGSSSTLHPSAP
jgi:hypothetical protein